MAIELLLLLVLAYLLLGPKQMTALARKSGKLLAQFNQAKADLKRKVEAEMMDLDGQDAARSSSKAAD